MRFDGTFTVGINWQPPPIWSLALVLRREKNYKPSL